MKEKLSEEVLEVRRISDRVMGIVLVFYDGVLDDLWFVSGTRRKACIQVETIREITCLGDMVSAGERCEGHVIARTIFW